MGSKSKIIYKIERKRMTEVYLKHHVYWQDNRRAEVFRTKNGDWGVRYFKNKKWLLDEIYREHSEFYAENAAENFVLGIKDVK